jgi:large subunit ribosomal protein L24
MGMHRIKVGDEVIVCSGADKGKRGTVASVVKREKKGNIKMMLKVEGIKLVRKHVKPNPNLGIQGGIVEQEALIDASNVALYNPSDQKASRVGIKVLEDGKKVRYFKSNGDVVDVGEGK